MDLNDLNSAAADEIMIGDQVETEQSQSSESSAESQEKSETEDESQKSEDGNVEDSQQAEDKKEGDDAESEANTSESEETGESDSESQEGEQSEEESEEGTTEETDDDDEAIHPDDFISEITEGKIDSTERLSEFLEEHQRLKEELEKPRDPEFANERAKAAYEYLQNHQGEFADLTKEAHRVLSIEPEGMSDRELQFEAFALQRKDLTRGEAQAVFDLKFEKLFGELEDDPDNVILKDELKVASIEAKAKIKEAQETLQSELAPKEADSTKSEKEEEGKATEEVTPEQIEEVQKAVDTSLNGYDKLQVNLGKEGKEVVNIALNNGQVDALNDAMTNPAALLDSAIAQFGSKDGSFDYDGYRDFMTKFIHHDRIVQESYNQGINVGKKLALDGAKNLQTKKTEEPPAKKEEPGFFDAFAEAVHGQKGSWT